MNLTIHQQRALMTVSKISNDDLRGRATMLVLARNADGLDALRLECTTAIQRWDAAERVSAARYLLSLDTP
jgi:hypothetical protein